MIKKHRDAIPLREYHGLRSPILLQQGDSLPTNLAITWVEEPSGARQMLNQHEPEQVSVMIANTGHMRVSEEEADAGMGDLISLPPMVIHAMENRSAEMLSSISAATPAFDIAAYYNQPPDSGGKSEGEDRS